VQFLNQFRTQKSPADACEERSAENISEAPHILSPFLSFLLFKAARLKENSPLVHVGKQIRDENLSRE
jgi:hypothetical protein